MKKSLPHIAFSLMEVIIAVGLFAVAATVVLGLLPALSRQSSAVTGARRALRVPDALRAELQRLTDTNGFDALATELAIIADPAPVTARFVAAADGARLHSLDYLPPPADDALRADAQYFLIEVWRFATGPLAYNAGDPVLTVHVRVSWPYRTMGSPSPTPLRERDNVTFNLALAR